MRFQLYSYVLFFFAAGSTFGQIFVPDVVSELAQFALNLFNE